MSPTQFQAQPVQPIENKGAPQLPIQSPTSHAFTQRSPPYMGPTRPVTKISDNQIALTPGKCQNQRTLPHAIVDPEGGKPLWFCEP